MASCELVYLVRCVWRGIRMTNWYDICTSSHGDSYLTTLTHEMIVLRVVAKYLGEGFIRQEQTPKNGTILSSDNAEYDNEIRSYAMETQITCTRDVLVHIPMLGQTSKRQNGKNVSDS